MVLCGSSNKYPQRSSNMWIRKEFTSKNTKEKISCGVVRTEETSHQSRMNNTRCEIRTRMGWCEIRTCMNNTKCEICHFELLIRMTIYHYRYLICQQFRAGSEYGILERWFCTMNKIEPPKVTVHGYKNCFFPLFFLFAFLLYLACLNDPKRCQNTKTSHKYD